MLDALMVLLFEDEINTMSDMVSELLHGTGKIAKNDFKTSILKELENTLESAKEMPND